MRAYGLWLKLVGVEALVHLCGLRARDEADAVRQGEHRVPEYLVGHPGAVFEHAVLRGGPGGEAVLRWRIPDAGGRQYGIWRLEQG